MISTTLSLRDQILAALRDGPRDLAQIHTALNMPQKDLSILPVIGKMVADGTVVKLPPQRRAYPIAAVQFALPEGTSNGR